MHLEHFPNVETRCYCPQAFLSLDFQCRNELFGRGGRSIGIEKRFIWLQELPFAVLRLFAVNNFDQFLYDDIPLEHGCSQTGSRREVLQCQCFVLSCLLHLNSS